jgi:hypothetical protein
MPNMIQLLRTATKGLSALAMAALFASNQACKEQAQDEGPRQLKRRVALGTIQAQQMPLPGGGTFDFGFAASVQMSDVLRTSKGFTIDNQFENNFDLDGMDEISQEEFHQCRDASETSEPAVTVFGKLGSYKMSATAACMIKMPQAIINTAFYDFELEQVIGGSVKFANFYQLGADAKIKTARLHLGMNAIHPVSGDMVATIDTSAKQQSLDVNGSINWGLIGIGGSYYYQDTLGKTVRKGLDTAVSSLKKQFDEQASFADKTKSWWATVLKNCDDDIFINAGGAYDSGLMVGDTFEVYNVVYDWSGDICNSKLNWDMPESSAPIGIFEVTVVGTKASKAKAIWQDPNVKIKPGARVYVHKLVDPKPKKTSTQPKQAVP